MIKTAATSGLMRHKREQIAAVFRFSLILFIWFIHGLDGTKVGICFKGYNPHIV